MSDVFELVILCTCIILKHQLYSGNSIILHIQMRKLIDQDHLKIFDSQHLHYILVKLKIKN